MKGRYLRPSYALPEIYLYRAPIDFRKQANGLALLVEHELGHSPFNGALYPVYQPNVEPADFKITYQSGCIGRYECQRIQRLIRRLSHCHKVPEDLFDAMEKAYPELFDIASFLNEFLVF